MKKIITWMVMTIVLLSAIVTAYNLGAKSTQGQMSSKLESSEENIAINETNQSEIILFRVEDYIINDESVILIGAKCGAFLRWTPDEDFVTSYILPAKYEINYETEMDYYTKYYDYGTIELIGGNIGEYFSNIFETASIKVDYIYLHIHNSNVMFIQQAIVVAY